MDIVAEDGRYVAGYVTEADARRILGALAYEQAEQDAADAAEQEAEYRENYERAAALGRHLHAYYAQDEDTRGEADMHEMARR